MLLSYFYTAAAFLLASEAHACFKAITAGIIDGKGSSYLSLSWGVPMISLGYSLFTSVMAMGDDPRCWVGWDNRYSYIIIIITITITNTIINTIAITILPLSLLSTRYNYCYHYHNHYQ